jgi:hypothetical protein
MKKTKKPRLASVSFARWAFYDAKDADDKDSMADWFETLYLHYQNRGKKNGKKENKIRR